jgi:competence protein ComEA
VPGDPADAHDDMDDEPHDLFDLPTALDDEEESGDGRHRPPGPTVRFDPGRPGARALWVAAAAAVALLLLWTWLQRPSADPVPVGSPQPVVETAGPAPSAAATPPVGEVADTATPVVVSVVGQVAEPGLVTLAPGSRVADAVEAAGGLLSEADAASVNLAAVVADGQQVAVGVPGAAGAPTPGAPTGPVGAGAVNLNAADVAALDGLPGIGPVLAQRIVEHRDQHGPFGSVDDLLDVAGIGPAVLEKVADGVTV